MPTSTAANDCQPSEAGPPIAVKAPVISKIMPGTE
jgi:hypothetical protein